MMAEKARALTALEVRGETEMARWGGRSREGMLVLRRETGEKKQMAGRERESGGEAAADEGEEKWETGLPCSTISNEESLLFLALERGALLTRPRPSSPR